MPSVGSDLAARDVAAATEFYNGLFGWNTFNDGETPYTIFQVGEAPVAGVMELSPEMGDMPPVWSAYVNVVDADATVAKVTEAGGMVMQPPFEIPGGGRIAVIGDPSGAAICLFEGMADNGMKLMDENGAPCWFDCMTPGHRRSRCLLTPQYLAGRPNMCRRWSTPCSSMTASRRAE